MTAVEKLRQEILRRLGTEVYLDKVSNLMDEIRALEKAQIINSYLEGRLSIDNTNLEGTDLDLAEKHFKKIQK